MLEKAQEDLRKKNYHLQSLKAGLSHAGEGDGGAFDSDALQKLLKLASGREEPSPLDCIEIIDQVYDDRCKVLNSAWEQREEDDAVRPRARAARPTGAAGHDVPRRAEGRGRQQGASGVWEE